MRSSSLMLLILPAFAACAGPPARAPGETDARCIHRLYDYPTRSVPFQTAANQCSGGGPVDLTGDRYYQLLASTLNVPYVTRDPKRDSAIVVTGSRLAQPTDRPVSPEVRLR